MSENLPPNEQPVHSNPASRPSGGAYWGGIALLAVGVYFLLRNLVPGFAFDFEWWAFFLIVPGALILKRVYDGYQAAGQTLDYHLRNQLVIGAGMLLFGIVFLLDISMHLAWPVALIIVGAAVLLNNLNRA